MFDDTGKNRPESLETLMLQRNQLLNGSRPVQMFPIGTKELSLSRRMLRTENKRGVFHYNPKLITEEEIQRLSQAQRENEFLLLGSYSKRDIVEKILKGEESLTVTEYTRNGVEIRSAIGCTSTINEQKAYFESTKQPNTLIVVGIGPQRILNGVERLRQWQMH
jgi:hypothetical protein